MTSSGEKLGSLQGDLGDFTFGKMKAKKLPKV